MNDSDFENELRHLLKPAPPSLGLQGRIQRELRERKAVPFAVTSKPGFLQSLLRDFIWACTGAAAALIALAFLPARPVPAKIAAAPSAPATAETQPNAFEHEASTNELVDSEDSDQLVETSDGPAREVHYNSRERHEWSNPRTGARVVLEVPREDVYLLPVSLQ